MFDKSDVFLPISHLLKTFIKYPYYFLTEEDVRSFLVYQLYKRLNLKIIKTTNDYKKTIAIHSEVRWYKYSSNKNKRTDIVLIDPNDLRVTNLYQKLSPKEYGFNTYWAAIELKLRRTQRFKSDKKLMKEVEDDMNLLNLVKNKTLELGFSLHDSSPIYCTICLDRGNNLKQKMDEIRNEYADNQIGLIYLNPSMF